MTTLELLTILERRERTGVGPILAHTECRFVRPLAFPDTVRARTAIRSVGNTSFVMAYEVGSEALEAVAATGSGVIVMIDYATGEKVPIDDALRSALRALPEPRAD